MNREVGSIVACKEFFGFAPGQSLLGFKNEVAKLAPKDKADMIPGLEKALGVTIKVS